MPENENQSFFPPGHELPATTGLSSDEYMALVRSSLPPLESGSFNGGGAPNLEPEHSSNGSRIGRKLAATAVTVGLLAGAGHALLGSGEADENPAAKSEGSPLDQDGGDQMVADVVALRELTDSESSLSVEDKLKLAKELQNPALTSSVEDLIRVDRILQVDTADSEAVAQLRDELPTETDKALLEKRVELDLARTIDDHISEPDALEEALSAIKDPELRSKAQRIVDLERVGNIKTSTSPDEEDLLNIDLIKDPELQKQARRIYELNATNWIANRYADQQLRAKLRDSIQSPDLKALAEIGMEGELDSQKRVDLDLEMYRVKDLAKKDQYRVREEIDVQASKHADTLRALRDSQADKVKSLQILQTAQEASSVAVPEVKKNITEGMNRVDLIQPDFDEDKLEPITIYDDGEYGVRVEIEAQRFADISVDESGKLTLRFAEGAVDQATKNQLLNIFTRVEPFIAAAVKNGSLIRASFIRETDETRGGAYYDPVTSEIVFPIPEGEDSQLSVDQVMGTLTHESLHALTDRKVVGETLTEEEFNVFVGVCDTLATNAYNEFEISISDISGKLDAFKKYLPSDKHGFIDEVKQKLADFQLEDARFRDTEYAEGYGLPFHCSNDSTIVGLMKSAASELGYYDITFEEGIEKDEDVIALNNEWFNAVRVFSVYALLNESNFVQTDDPNKMYYGHTEDSASELIASFVHAAIQYPNELAEEINGMQPEEREALKRLLRTSVDMIAQDNPELLGAMSEIEARLLFAIN